MPQKNSQLKTILVLAKSLALVHPNRNDFFIDFIMTQMFFSILKTLNRQPSDVIDHQPELKTEEGYRYRYIPGDICTFYVRTTSST